jgi:hypothetical protein
MRIPVVPQVAVVRHDDPPSAILAESERCDLLVLGMRRRSSGRKALGQFNRRILFGAPCAVMLLSRRTAAMSELYRPLRGVVQDAVAVMPWATRRADTQDE